MTVKELKKWFTTQKRELPWRENPTPYRVWVSEIMLQQTQASVVIPYFERWMERFPTIQALAAAELDEVIKLWEGLGYYARARNLHQGARYVVEKYKGILPDQADLLAPIKGLGDYTIGALLSFAFHQRAPAVDGNVIRVLSRYLAIEEDVAKQATVRKIRAEALNLLPDEEPWIIAEALIELGATICQKKPKCAQCPLRKECKAFARGIAKDLPFKSTKTASIPLFRAVPVIEHEGSYLLRKIGEGKIMSDLHEFPYFDMDPEQIDSNSICFRTAEELSLKVKLIAELPQEAHSFTKYRVKLYPFLLKCLVKSTPAGFQWVARASLKELPFSSGHRRICSQLLQQR